MNSMQTLNVHQSLHHHYHNSTSAAVSSSPSIDDQLLLTQTSSSIEDGLSSWNTSSTATAATAMHSIDAKPSIDPSIKGGSMSPGNNNNNNTVSAAADSSDTQVKSNTTASADGDSPELQNDQRAGAFATTIASGQYEQHNTAAHFPLQQQSVESAPVIADLGNYFLPNQPTGFPNAYEGYYHAAPISDMTGIAGGFMSSQQPQQQQQQHHNRFHPYNNGVGSMRTDISSSALHNDQLHQPLAQQQPTSQLTPTPSPKQCEKCSFYCETNNELQMHYINEHGGDHAAANVVNVKTETGNNAGNDYPFDNAQQQQTASGKEAADAPATDILDLDSQKMVYGQQQQQPQHGPLPPMHSLHPMHSRGIIWSHHDSYASMYPSQQHQQQQPTHLTQHTNQQHHQQHHQHHHQQGQLHNLHTHHHHQQQQQQSMQMNAHAMHHQQHSTMAHHSPLHLQGHQHQPMLHIKDEFGIQPKTTQTSPNSNGLIPPKDVASNNLHSSSPSEFPSTTTPQHEQSAVATTYRNNTSGIVGNGSNSLILPSHHQQQATDPPATGCMSGSTFEAATSSSLPTPPVVAKSGTWKSNEARRPKTYNCTACNKWFTSSGHLKRHYNTTLHKNAVKSSGIVDPATKPTSMFHHPDRDQNKLHKVSHNHVPPVIQPPLQPQAPPSNASSSDGASDNANDFTPYAPTMGFSPHHQHISHHPHQNQQQHHHVFRAQSSTENHHHHEQLQQSQQSQQSLNNNANNHHSVHPNGQAGPSVQISQSRGLQFTMTKTTGTNNNINSDSNSHICSTTINESIHQRQPLVPPMANLQHLASKESISSTLNVAETYHQMEPIKLELPSHQPNQATQSTEFDNTLHPQQQQQQLHQQFSMITNNITTSTNINNNISTISSQCPTSTTQPLISTTPTTITNHWQLDMSAAQQQQPLYHHHTNITESPLLPTITTIMPVSMHQQLQQPLLSLQQLNPSIHLYTTTPIIISSSEDPSQQQQQPLVLPSIRSITGNHHHYLDRSDEPACANIAENGDTDGALIPMQQKPQLVDMVTLIDLDANVALQQQQQQQQQQTTTHVLQPSPNNTSAVHTSAVEINDDTIDSTTSIVSTEGGQSDTKRDERVVGRAEESTPFNTPPHTPSVVLIASTASTANANQNERKTRKPYQRRSKQPSVVSNAVKSTSTSTAAARNTGDANGNNDRSEVCAPCKKTFNRLCYLTQHNQSFHSGARPYKCATCGKRFACHDACVAHSAKHNGNKPFKCEQCPKQFNHKTDLRRHMCLHQNLKPHTCEECGKSFVRRDHKVKHVQTHARRAAIAAEKENRLAEARGIRSVGGARDGAGHGNSAAAGGDANSTDSMDDVTKTKSSQLGMHNNCNDDDDDESDDDDENDGFTDNPMMTDTFSETIRPNLARI